MRHLGGIPTVLLICKTRKSSAPQGSQAASCNVAPDKSPAHPTSTPAKAAAVAPGQSVPCVNTAALRRHSLTTGNTAASSAHSSAQYAVPGSGLFAKVIPSTQSVIPQAMIADTCGGKPSHCFARPTGPQPQRISAAVTTQPHTLKCMRQSHRATSTQPSASC
jgi:hypothetical protein